MPTTMDRTDYARVANAIRFVTEHANGQPTLDDVAAHVGLSGPHFQRTFKRFAGVSPKRFLQLLTVEAAKERLRDAHAVLDTSHAVGLSGPGRLHDLFVALEALTPGEFKRQAQGLSIGYGYGATPFGDARVAWTPRGICALDFVDDRDDTALRARWPNATWQNDDTEATTRLTRAFATQDAVALQVSGTNWQVQVWRALLRIPDGAVVSYSDLAAHLGRRTAARAVASAVARNPIAYLIPCHRVLRQSGALSGYRWDPVRKHALLAREWA